MKTKHLLKFFILVSICIFLSGCGGKELPSDNISENLAVNNSIVAEKPLNYSDNGLTLTLIPEILSVDEIYTLQLILKNQGKHAVNVSKLEEHVTYNIIYSNGSNIEYIHLPSIDAMGDDYLVELKPNESLSINVSSGSWEPFNKGNYSLSAKYFTGYNTFTKPHWNGELRSNNITLIVE